MAADFNGTNDRYDTSDTAFSAATLTAMVWFRPDNTSHVGSLWNQTSSSTSTPFLNLQMQSGGAVRFNIRDNGGNSTFKDSGNSATANAWNLAAGFGVASIKAEVKLNDGTRVSATGPNRGFPTTNQMAIGATMGGGSSANELNGQIGAVGLWTTELTDAEQDAAYGGLDFRRIRPANLVRFWRLPRGLASIPDLTGTGQAMSEQNGVDDGDDFPRIFGIGRGRNYFDAGAAPAGGLPFRLAGGGGLAGAGGLAGDLGGLAA